MATTPTNKPIPSEDPRDLKFNAGKIDEVVTSNAHYYTDRFGVRRWTIAGFQYTAEEAIRNYGYITMDSFEDGSTLTLPNQVLRYKATGEYYRWDGEFPKTVSAASTPETSGGVGLGAWVGVGDASLRADLSSKNGIKLIGGDLESYGADASGSIPCDNQLSQMLADKKFIVNSGTYLITSSHEVDISSLEYIEVGPDVEFIIRSNINGFIFKNPNANFDANGMRITVDIPGGGYTGIALTLRGSKYYTGPSNLGRLTQKNKFGPFYVFNRQGAVKQESASTPVTDEGYGFSIDCNSADEEILIWNEVDVSSTGFTVAHAIGVGTNPLNFISSLDLKLVAWFSTYHFRDTSIPQSGGNVAGGIGDVHVRLQSQPHAQMVKVVHMEHAPGFMSGCRFDLSIWDPNAYGYTANVVDASVTNEYTNTMERKSYPLTRVLNMVDGSIFPVVNYTSSIQQSDILSSSDPELAKYLYLSTVTPGMTVLQACNAIKTWCNENNIRNNFEFKVFLGDSTVDIRNVFLPWITAIGDASGYLCLYATFYNGIINTVRVEYEVNPITSGGKTEKHEILWTNTTGLVSHRLIEYSFGTTAEIKSKVAIQTKGFATFDSTFNIPVWYNGNNSWLKADGSVAYSI
nr:MAG TPA: tail spike [Caudoviricetes sp.]